MKFVLYELEKTFNSQNMQVLWKVPKLEHMETALVRVANDIVLNNDTQNCVCLFLDLTTAFDTVESPHTSVSQSVSHSQSVSTPAAIMSEWLGHTFFSVTTNLF